MPNTRPLRSLSVSSNANKHTNAAHGPPSPTFSDATNASAINFGSDGPEKIITRADLKASLQAYDDVRTRILGPYLTPQRSLSESFGAALERLRELSFSADVSVQGDLTFRGCHGVLFEVWPATGFSTSAPVAESAPKLQTEGSNLRNLDEDTRRFWSPPPHGKPMAHYGASPHLRHLLIFDLVIRISGRFVRPEVRETIKASSRWVQNRCRSQYLPRISLQPSFTPNFA